VEKKYLNKLITLIRFSSLRATKYLSDDKVDQKHKLYLYELVNIIYLVSDSLSDDEILQKHALINILSDFDEDWKGKGFDPIFEYFINEIDDI